jgi:hypothetical protein
MVAKTSQVRKRIDLYCKSKQYLERAKMIMKANLTGIIIPGGLET